MSDQKLVGRIRTVERPPMSAGRPTGVQPCIVQMEDGSSCLIDPASPIAAHHERTLQMLQHAAMPVYLETVSPANTISRLLIPSVFSVDDVAATPEGGKLDVRLRISHARHFVRTTNPDYQNLVDALRAAQQRGDSVVITEEPDRPEIIDVRPATSALRAVPVPAAGAAIPLTPAFSGSVPLATAQQMFDLVNAESCPTNMSSPSCIPFLYPDDGCWARAHEMCRLMISNGVTPMKVWLYGTLHVNTSNSPVCAVDWGWHVAPLLAVDTGMSTDPYVVDPSLFAAPAPLGDWIAIQNTSVPPSATDTTDASIYLTAKITGTVDELDPGYSQTNVDLNTYRLKFANRCAVDNPPGPPYACP